MFFLFAHREAEVAKLPAYGEVLSVGEGHEPALLEIELPLAVYEALVGVDADYFRQEHGVRAQELLLGDPAFKAQGTLLDERSRHLVGGQGMEAAGG